MKYGIIVMQYEPHPGATIEQVMQEVTALANQMEAVIRFTFNGIQWGAFGLKNLHETKYKKKPTPTPPDDMQCDILNSFISSLEYLKGYYDSKEKKITNPEQMMTDIDTMIAKQKEKKC